MDEKKELEKVKRKNEENKGRKDKVLEKRDKCEWMKRVKEATTGRNVRELEKLNKEWMNEGMKKKKRQNEERKGNKVNALEKIDI